MPAINAISPDKLIRLIGTPSCPALIDLRPSGDLIPGSVRRPPEGVDAWAGGLGASSAILICRDGAETSPGVAAWLRHAGLRAEILEGGAEAWASAGLPMVREAVLPPRDVKGRTLWVTRARPEGRPDRLPLADPPLRRSGGNHPLRRAGGGGGRRRAHGRGAIRCRGRVLEPSRRTVHLRRDGRGVRPGRPCRARTALATIVRGADTARPEIAPQAAGLLAVSLGLSRMYADDLEQLEAGMPVYDAFYRWCRDAIDETHDWVSHKPRTRAPA